MMPPRHCCRCGAELPATAAPHARYCSPACRNAAYKARKRAERADRIHAQFSERAEAPKAAAPVGEEECAALVIELAMAATTLKEAAQTAPPQLRARLYRIADGCLRSVESEVGL